MRLHFRGQSRAVVANDRQRVVDGRQRSLLEHQIEDGAAYRTHAPDGTRRERLSETQVRFKHLSGEEISAYLAGGEWHGKAGGYAIQGRAEAFVRQINGSYSNVVGLPLQVTAGLLSGLGFSVL